MNKYRQCFFTSLQVHLPETQPIISLINLDLGYISKVLQEMEQYSGLPQIRISFLENHILGRKKYKSTEQHANPARKQLINVSKPIFSRHRISNNNKICSQMRCQCKKHRRNSTQKSNQQKIYIATQYPNNQKLSIYINQKGHFRNRTEGIDIYPEYSGDRNRYQHFGKYVESQLMETQTFKHKDQALKLFNLIEPYLGKVIQKKSLFLTDQNLKNSILMFLISTYSKQWNKQAKFTSERKNNQTELQLKPAEIISVVNKIDKFITDNFMRFQSKLEKPQIQTEVQQTKKNVIKNLINSQKNKTSHHSPKTSPCKPMKQSHKTKIKTWQQNQISIGDILSKGDKRKVKKLVIKILSLESSRFSEMLFDIDDIFQSFDGDQKIFAKKVMIQIIDSTIYKLLTNQDQHLVAQKLKKLELIRPKSIIQIQPPQTQTMNDKVYITNTNANTNTKSLKKVWRVKNSHKTIWNPRVDEEQQMKGEDKQGQVSLADVMNGKQPRLKEQKKTSLIIGGQVQKQKAQLVINNCNTSVTQSQQDKKSVKMSRRSNKTDNKKMRTSQCTKMANYTLYNDQLLGGPQYEQPIQQCIKNGVRSIKSIKSNIKIKTEKQIQQKQPYICEKPKTKAKGLLSKFQVQREDKLKELKQRLQQRLQQKKAKLRLGFYINRDVNRKGISRLIELKQQQLIIQQQDSLFIMKKKVRLIKEYVQQIDIQSNHQQLKIEKKQDILKQITEYIKIYQTHYKQILRSQSKRVQPFTQSQQIHKEKQMDDLIDWNQIYHQKLNFMELTHDYQCEDSAQFENYQFSQNIPQITKNKSRCCTNTNLMSSKLIHSFRKSQDNLLVQKDLPSLLVKQHIYQTTTASPPYVFQQLQNRNKTSNKMTNKLDLQLKTKGKYKKQNNNQPQKKGCNKKREGFEQIMQRQKNAFLKERVQNNQKFMLTENTMLDTTTIT